MDSTNKSAAVPVVVGSILSCLTTLGVVELRRPDVTVGETGIGRPSTAGIEERLERIEALLAAERADSALVPRMQEATRRVISASTSEAEDDPLVGRFELALRSLDRLIDRLERAPRPALRATVGDPAAPLARGVPVDWAAIADLAALDQVDSEAARAELVLLTAAEVIERFGSPPRAEATNSQGYDMWWNYRRLDANRDVELDLELYFGNGYVLYSDCTRR